MKNILILCALLAVGCDVPVKKVTKIVVVSKEYNDGRFGNWVHNIDPQIKIISLYDLTWDSVLFYVANSDGAIISGGADVHPSLYGKSEEIERCGATNTWRDSIELHTIKFSIANKKPIIGVCRGEQIMNVTMGGTLIIDIPTDFDTTVIHRMDGEYIEHLTKTVEGTKLAEICGTSDNLLVKSKHHQAVDNIADIFNIAAYSPDSLIEAIEISDKTIHPFAIGVQWHPEMMDYNHPYSKPIMVEFLKNI